MSHGSRPPLSWFCLRLLLGFLVGFLLAFGLVRAFAQPPATTITLTWEPAPPFLVEGKPVPITSYQIYRRQGTEGYGAPLKTVPATQTQTTDTVSAAGTYSYVVKTVATIKGRAHASDASNEVHITIDLPPVQDLVEGWRAVPETIIHGDSVTVQWTGISAPTPTDWIGLYRPGAPPEQFLDWFYVSCTKTATTSGRSGTCVLPFDKAPEPGAYALKLLARDSMTVMASTPLTITAPPCLCSEIVHGVKLVSVDSEDARTGAGILALDGNALTHWHTARMPTVAHLPHTITVDMGRERALTGMRVLPRQDGQTQGTIAKFTLATSLDQKAWTTRAQGEWPKDTKERSITILPVRARYVRLIARSEMSGKQDTSLAELTLLALRDGTADGS